MHRKSRLWILFTLGLMLLASLALRTWYASAELHVNRFEDERYSLSNVRKILFHGDLEPASGYYPSPVFNLPQVALLKASDALYRKTGHPEFAVFNSKGEFLAPTFLLTRFVQVVCGTVSILIVFLIGRHMFSPATGLLGALIFAFLPWNLHASGYNKPDAMLVMGIVLSFYASLKAVEKARPRFYILAGVAIALTMSCKLTGGLIAVPLIVATLIEWRDRRRVALLALAGLTSVITFVLTNPYWPAYVGFLEGLKRDYAGRTSDSRWTIPLKVVDFLTDSFAHGTLAGSLVLLALGWMAFRLLRWRLASASTTADERFTRSTQRTQLLMFLAFPVCYTVTYALQTAYFKPNNFLLILPFSSLALAWLMVEVWRSGERHLAARLPTSAVVGVAVVMSVGLIFWTATPGFLYVYRSLIPTTWEAASVFLGERLAPRRGRLIYSENWREAGPRWEGARPLHEGESGFRWVEDLGRLTSEQLDLVDGLLYRRDPENRDSGFDRERPITRVPPREVGTFEPSPFKLRGSAVVAVAHPRGLLHPAEQLEVRHCRAGEGCMIAELPGEAEPGELVTFLVWVSPALMSKIQAGLTVSLGGRELDVQGLGRQGPNHYLVTERIPRPAGKAAIRINSTTPIDASDPLIGLRWMRWQDTAHSPRDRVSRSQGSSPASGEQQPINVTGAGP